MVFSFAKGIDMRCFSGLLIIALLMSCAPTESVRPKNRVLSFVWVDDFDLEIAFSLENVTSREVCVPLTPGWRDELQSSFRGDVTLATRDGDPVLLNGDPNAFGLEMPVRKMEMLPISSGSMAEGTAYMGGDGFFLGDQVTLEMTTRNFKARVEVSVTPCDDVDGDVATLVFSKWLLLTQPEFEPYE
ncbi:MAG: hypothetical protein ACI91Z_000198 [Yoonia sp.]|jgi:hypothetical protein